MKFAVVIVVLAFFLSVPICIDAKDMQIEFHVMGMVCSSCEAKVHNVLKDRKGILSYTIDTQLDSVRINYNQQEVDIQQLLSLLQSTGYETKIKN